MNTFTGEPSLYEEPQLAQSSESQELDVRDRSALGKATFAGVVLFCCAFFFRPQDLFPALASFPIAKVIGIITSLTLVLGFASRSIRLTREVFYLLAFFGYLCVCIPLAIWKGGSFELVVLGLSKFILIAIATMGVLVTVDRLRKVMLVQAIAILLLAAVSLYQYKAGRMFGVGSMFSDPNELALNLCVVLPTLIALIISSRRKLATLFWLACTALALLAIISTFSRGGFLALLVVGISVPWRFRLRRNTTLKVALVAAAMSVGAVLYVGPASYLERIQTISNPDADTSGAAADRQELLRKSIETSFQHPIFGVGPGNFQQVSGSWHQSHNTYTQLSSEAGFPALILFLVLMRITLKNAASAKKLENRDQFWYLSAAVQCGTLSYMVGAIFLSTTYWFLPYLLVAYAAAVARITQNRLRNLTTANSTEDRDAILRTI